MESVINIEDRLRVIKAMFELSVEAKTFPGEIRIYTIYQKWGIPSNFRSESLALSMNDQRHKKTIEIIYGLSNEIISLFQQLIQFIGEMPCEYKYRIESMPGGNSLGQLNLVRWVIRSEDQVKFRLIEDEWRPYNDINNEHNSDYIQTIPLALMDFVLQINQFLKERLLISSQPGLSSSNSEYTVKSIIIAYYYMYKKGIYPIPEITQKGKKLLFYRKLAEKYELGFDSFRTDWAPLEITENRLAYPENIKLAIDLLKTITDANIQDVIQLANKELKEAELKI